ncbi:subtilase-type protease inhibitor [Streptomyces sp. NPDC014894]|uniref:subtilase-type protease inhibitor n=1 Tax=unclassified Streptomyces TaxID=2593676 RepID=UPI003703616B
MRSVRSTIAVTAALVLSGVAAVSAQAAQPRSAAVPPVAAHTLTHPAAEAGAGAGSALYAPSAFVLSVGKGADPMSAAVQRAVTLSCSPGARGTHPAPAAACDELRSVDGEVSALPTALPQTICTREWDPVTVTADGVWRGERVSWSATYNNGCEMGASLGGGALFSF